MHSFCTSKPSKPSKPSNHRTEEQSAFGQRLPGILRKDVAGWRVVDYTETDECLKITFAHASQTADDEDDLVQMQIDFTRHYTCHADYD